MIRVKWEGKTENKKYHSFLYKDNNYNYKYYKVLLIFQFNSLFLQFRGTSRTFLIIWGNLYVCEIQVEELWATTMEQRLQIMRYFLQSFLNTWEDARLNLLLYGTWVAMESATILYAHTIKDHQTQWQWWNSASRKRCLFVHNFSITLTFGSHKISRQRFWFASSLPEL